MIRTITLTALLAGTAHPAVGGTLHAQEAGPTLAALLAEAEERSPRIEVARHAAEAAEARVPQAGALPDPTLSVGMMNVPLSDPDRGPPGAGLLPDVRHHDGVGMGMLLMVLLWAVVIALLFWLVYRLVGRRGRGRDTRGPDDVLDERYARGDIDRETYERMREDIER